MDVEQVLAEIGAGGSDGAPMIEAWNKIDRLNEEDAASVRAEAARREDVAILSALTGEGVEALLNAAAEKLREGARARKVVLSASEGQAIAWLHAHGEVLSADHRGIETEYDVRLSDTDWARFHSHFPGER
jgi:GTP-binding protein HflX